MIRHADLLDAGQVDHVQLVGLRLDAGGFDVILQRLGNSGEQKFMIGAFGLRAHGGFFPLGAAAVLGEQPGVRGCESDQSRCDQLI
jgi:hypothetical protein